VQLTPEHTYRFVVPEVWDLLRGLARGEDTWAQLLVELEPELLAIARRQPLGRLRGREDTPREIVTRVFARLQAHDHAAVKKLCEREPAPALGAWLRVLVRRSAIDYMRASPEFERGSDERPHRWVSLATLSSDAAGEDPDSRAKKRELVVSTVRDMVARARTELETRGEEAFTHLALVWKVPRIHVRRLATKGDRFLAVLVSLFEGRSHTEIARGLAISRREVELTIGYVQELLQARFAEDIVSRGL
jgi:DNA-directed RNA polymerase specialized sigma24 family protein